MHERERIEDAIRSESLPDWVERISVREMVDADGEPALAVLIVVKEDRTDIVKDAVQLANVRDAVHRAIRSVNVERWPYTRFVSADELEAA
jgi:hypothetical protein